MEGDRNQIKKRLATKTFQSSPSCGGRPLSAVTPPRVRYISILALVWRATKNIRNNRCFVPFQSSPSCGGRLYHANQTVHSQDNFNPRPRVEGDFQSRYRGAYRREFQSSPSCGGRPSCILYHEICNYFNPRPRVEGDVNFNICIQAYVIISILALVWRATPPLFLLPLQAQHFNPRPRVEGDNLI